MTPAEHLAFNYPKLAGECSADLPPYEVEQALEIAAAYAPACLSDEEKNMAIAFYAAHLLEQRASNSQGGPLQMVLVEEAEVSVRKRYQSAASLNNRGQILSPFDRYMLLKRKCGRGSIINSGWGPPCRPLV